MISNPFTGIEELLQIHRKMGRYIHKTPVMTSRSFNQITGSECFFKCENFQRMGAFKMRGAINALLHLNPEEKLCGVATHSSGNFAQAMSLAASLSGVKATVIMPESASGVKKDAVRSYGGNIIECESTLKAREESLDKFISQTGAISLHPSNQKEVIDGNSTALIELLNEVKNLDTVIVPVGGGGLLAGTALAGKQINKNLEIYGAEPTNVNDAFLSLQTGIIQPPTNKFTIADGLKTNLGDKNFPIIKKWVNSILLVEEDEIIYAMKWIWERMKIIIEPSSAVAVAAILKSPHIFSGKKTGIILSGGNAELSKLPF